MGATKQLFALDRQRQDDEDLATEYAEMGYLNRSRQRIGPPIVNADPGDEQPEKPTGETAHKPKKS